MSDCLGHLLSPELQPLPGRNRKAPVAGPTESPQDVRTWPWHQRQPLSQGLGSGWTPVLSPHSELNNSL